LGGKEGNDAGNIDGLTDTVVWRPGGGVLIDLVVVHLLASGTIFLADGVVHVCLDATWGDAVDGDLLVAGI
jgi:hypothetical protein